VLAAHALASRPEAERWLIEQVWMDQSVGIVGGEPKLGKSLAALSMAVSLASGAPYLGRFRVAQTGRTLLFAAEDAQHIVRARLEALCFGLDLALADLDIQVITAPRMRIDSTDHQKSLADTLAAIRPKLLILDPFVRLHTRDENQCAEVAPLLGFLRDLQRTFEVAVAVVHHTRKGAGRTRGGQALRGSSEFHAWVDDAQYLRHSGDRVLLTIEHRAAPCIDKLEIKLRAHGDALKLEVVDDQAAPIEDPAAPSATDRILQVLADTKQPLPLKALSRMCSIRHERFLRALGALVRDGRVIKTNGNYRLAA
jgi:RecA-family ATPase